MEYLVPHIHFIAKEAEVPSCLGMNQGHMAGEQGLSVSTLQAPHSYAVHKTSGFIAFGALAILEHVLAQEPRAEAATQHLATSSEAGW